MVWRFDWTPFLKGRGTGFSCFRDYGKRGKDEGEKGWGDLPLISSRIFSYHPSTVDFS